MKFLLDIFAPQTATKYWMRVIGTQQRAAVDPAALISSGSEAGVE
jgi:hypothetical protein